MMATHTLIERQRELIQKLKSLIETYEQDVADAKALHIFEKNDSNQRWQQTQADLEQPIKQAREMGKSTVDYLKKEFGKLPEGGTPETFPINKNANAAEQLNQFLEIVRDKKDELKTERYNEWSKALSIIFFACFIIFGFVFFFSSPLVGGILSVSSFAIAVFCLYIYRVQTARRKNRYATLMDVVVSIEDLQTQQLATAQAIHEQRLAEIEQNYKTHVEQLKQTFSGKLAQLRAEFAAYVQETRFVGWNGAIRSGGNGSHHRRCILSRAWAA